jgi:hypothetical protein
MILPSFQTARTHESCKRFSWVSCAVLEHDALNR